MSNPLALLEQAQTQQQHQLTSPKSDKEGQAHLPPPSSLARGSSGRIDLLSNGDFEGSQPAGAPPLSRSASLAPQAVPALQPAPAASVAEPEAEASAQSNPFLAEYRKRQAGKEGGLKKVARPVERGHGLTAEAISKSITDGAKRGQAPQMLPGLQKQPSVVATAPDGNTGSAVPEAPAFNAPPVAPRIDGDTSGTATLPSAAQPSAAKAKDPRAGLFADIAKRRTDGSQKGGLRHVETADSTSRVLDRAFGRADTQSPPASPPSSPRSSLLSTRFQDIANRRPSIAGDQAEEQIDAQKEAEGDSWVTN